MSHELEICIACDSLPASLRNARAAARGGANRLECCASMHHGGLTPDPEIIEAIRNAVPSDVAVLAMVRPRDGNFEWSPAEADVMLHAIRDMASAGASGIVSGALQGRKVDAELTDRLISKTREAGMAFTFHRALDATTDRIQALTTLMTLGCHRVLSAGTPWGSALGARDGIDELERMAAHHQGRMDLVVGGGISVASVRLLLPKLKHHNNISFHAYSSVMVDGYTDAGCVAALRNALNA